MQTVDLLLDDDQRLVDVAVAALPQLHDLLELDEHVLPGKRALHGSYHVVAIRRDGQRWRVSLRKR